MIQYAHRLFHELNFKRTEPCHAIPVCKKKVHVAKKYSVCQKYGTRKSSVREKVDARTV
jgi:hypothetical protein